MKQFVFSRVQAVFLRRRCTRVGCWLDWDSGLVVDRDQVEAPLRGFRKLPRRQCPQIIAYDDTQVVALFAIHGGFGWFDVMRGARLDLDEAEHVLVPSDEINFAAMPRRAVVARDHHVTFAPEIEVRIFFSAPADGEVGGARVTLTWKAIEKAKCSVS